MVSWLVQYWIVAAFSVLLLLLSSIFYVRAEARDGILSNAPWAMMGIAISALVTVYIVNSAIQSADEQRWRPLSQTILERVRAHSQRCIATLSRKISPPYEPARGRLDRFGRRDRVRDAIDETACFAHLTPDERQILYQEIRLSANVLRDELAIHQAFFSRHPDLYRVIVELERRVLGWSVYRDATLDPDVTAEEESPTICQTADAVIAIDAELENLPARLA